MAAITSLHVHISTGGSSGAGTDGDVYVGFCGREFYLDSTKDDFERNTSHSYVLGAGATVKHADLNDPRKPQLHDTDIDRFPVYLRFVGRGRGDNWQVARAVISYNDQTFPMWEAIWEGEGLWMGTRATGFAYLQRHVD